MVPLYKNFSYSSQNFVTRYHEFDSMLDEYPRLLGCSSDLFMPVNTTSRLLITSTDVIHSFSLPSLGLKVDALPGRINQLFSNPSRVGGFFGQCSEICGSNHTFMPIRVKICGLMDFDSVSKMYLLDSLADLPTSVASL